MKSHYKRCDAEKYANSDMIKSDHNCHNLDPRSCITAQKMHRDEVRAIFTFRFPALILLGEIIPRIIIAAY
jgi:hypothetical protein